ncbi:MAG: LPS-assembly protein LptD [Alphaproteobacteria bacterium]|nr:LPS-assembly protein LptD [Alphaproteobacteria bacterium]
MLKKINLLSTVLLCFSLSTSFSFSKEKAVPIYFSADEIIEDSNTKIITAQGDVVITREKTTLKADVLTFDREKDILTAKGNVSISQDDGSVIYANQATLSDKMSKGTINEVKAILADESRMSAKRIKQTAKKDKHFFRATYSPCDVCGENAKPLWSIKARKVTHDNTNHDVYYRSAYLTIKDVPVLYSPFLSHPDPTVKRRSGFMMPSVISNKYLRAAVGINYFINLNEHEDILLSPIFSDKQDVVFGGRYRKMLYNGELSTTGTIMKDKDTNKTRGNITAIGRYEINDLWLAKMDINYASDGAYLKDLSLPGKTDTWLTSTVSFERFKNRDYASIEGYSYKLVSYSLRKANIREFKNREYSKPYILPLATYEKISETNSIGAYFKNTFNVSSVYREHDETQTQRATMINSWNLPYTSPFGEKYRFMASVKSDLYYIDDYYNNNQNYTGAVGRIFPQAAVEWRLPFVKATDSSRQIIEPIVVAVAAPNGGNKISKIPNEDSLNAQLDDTNILDIDRYAGYDRNDTGSRVSYGLNWSSYGNILGRTSSFFGQSYYINKKESFAQSLGDDSKLSDYVGRLYAAPHSYLDVNYRFRLDKDNYNVKYSELNSRIGSSILSANISFISIKGRDKKGGDTNLYFFDDYKQRKELFTSLNAKLSKNWGLQIYNRQNLAKQDKRSLEHGGKLIYEDECFKLITNVHKYDSTDPDYDDGYEFSITFLLKTLGSIGSK